MSGERPSRFGPRHWFHSRPFASAALPLAGEVWARAVTIAERTTRIPQDMQSFMSMFSPSAFDSIPYIVLHRTENVR